MFLITSHFTAYNELLITKNTKVTPHFWKQRFYFPFCTKTNQDPAVVTQYCLFWLINCYLLFGLLREKRSSFSVRVSFAGNKETFLWLYILKKHELTLQTEAHRQQTMQTIFNMFKCISINKYSTDSKSTFFSFTSFYCVASFLN